jgi:hypothetical protein
MLLPVGAFLWALILAPIFEETDFPFRPLCAEPELVFLFVLVVFWVGAFLAVTVVFGFAAFMGAAMLERAGLLLLIEMG